MQPSVGRKQDFFFFFSLFLELLAHLLLPLDDVRELGVGDPRVQLALHEGRPLVVFDVSQVAALRHLDVFGEALRGSKEAN